MCAMPHSTSHMRAPSQNRLSNANGSPAHNGTEKFPDFDAAHVFDSSAPNGGGRQQQQNGYGYSRESATQQQPEQRWHAHAHARRDSRVKWAPGAASSHAYGHARKRSSISTAIHRMRSGSMSQNAHEIADALRAPVSWKLIVCPMSPVSSFPACATMLICLVACCVVTMHNVVLVLRPDQHLLQVHPHGL